MLQTMRKFTSSWFVKGLFLALAASFVLWGIGDIFRGGATDTSVASVGDAKISYDIFQRDYRNVVRNAGRDQPEPLTPEQAQKLELPRRTLESLLSQTAVDLEVQKLGLTMGDAQIAAMVKSVPQFAGPLGTFDRATFLQRLQSAGFTEQAYVDELRQDGKRQQMLAAARNGFTIPPGMVRMLYAYLKETRAVQYITVPESAAAAVPAPTDTQLNAYIKAHPDRFSVPDYRAISYAAITPEDVASQVAVTDAQIAQEYQARLINPQYAYNIDEKRDLEQLNFPNAASAKAARAKIDSGTSFADLATSLHTTPIALGTTTKSQLGDRGDAVFALPENGVTQPVKNLSGYILLHVVKITPGSRKALADVKDTIRKDIAQQLAKAKVVDIAQAYTDASSGGLSLADAARKVGMHFVQIPAVDENGLAPDGTKANIPADPVFQAQIFKTEIGQEGDPFEGKDGQQYVLNVTSETPSRLKPLAMVRDQATAQWLAEARQKALAAKAKTLADAINSGRALPAIASDLKTTVQNSPALEREKPNAELPADLMLQIFAAPPGKAVAGKAAKSGAYIVARVTGVSHPVAPASDPNYAKFAQDLSAGTADDIAASIALAVRAKEGEKVNQKQLDLATGAGGEGS